MPSTAPGWTFMPKVMAAWGLASVAWTAELTLVGEGQPPLPIVAEPAVEPHARALAAYLKRISGAEFSVQTHSEAPEQAAILVGDFGRSRVRDFPGDSFEIVCAGGQLRISGTTGPAVGFGVYAFLEEGLGCRWWSADEEDVPVRSSLRVPETQAVHRAVFTQTVLLNQEAQTDRNSFAYKARVRNAERWSGSHTLYPLLSPYGRQHPEIYPFSRKTGQRGPNQIHFCYSSPGIAEALTEALAGVVKEYRGDVRNLIYMAGMGDWYGGQCECDRCEAVYQEEGYTDAQGVRRGIIGGTNLRMINRVAELLEERFPGIKVGTMAYMSMEAPPTQTVPRTNVYIRVPHLRHCILHDVGRCPRNGNYLSHLRRWCELAPGRVHVWDYGANFGENFLYPFPVITAIGRNIQIYARLGVAGVMIQGNYVSTGGDLVVLKNYVWRKLLWDPSRDIPALIREFCDGYYGPAADPLFAYVMELENAVSVERQPQVHMNEFGRREDIRKAYLTPERMATLRSQAQEARAAVAGRDPFARRVEEAVVGLDAFELWHPGPLVEQEGRLMRADLGPAYTYDRAKRVCEFARKASAREWNSYRVYHQQLLALQGGPLVTLRRGDVEVKVAPALAMRIRQIMFRGRPLLVVPSDFREKGWPNLGGAYESTFVPWTHGELVEVASECHMRMRTEAGSGSTVKQEATKEVELFEPHTLRVRVATRAMARGNDFAHTRAAQVTEYLAGTRAGWAVALQEGNGDWRTLLRWKPASPTPSPLEAAIPPETSALRITLDAAECVIEERFVSPAIRGGKVSFDPRKGVLTTSAETVSVPLPEHRSQPWLERWWIFQASDGRSS